MKVVLDPNVLVSAAVAAGVSAELLDRWFVDRPFEMVVCPALLEELREVLGRPKFRRWITAAQTATFIDRFEAEAQPWPDPTEVPPVTSDPKDDYLVALYRNADADLLVSGDSDLLELDADDVTVVTPGELLQRL